jgi:hypothetical protein
MSSTEKIRLKFKGQDGTEMPIEIPMNATLYEYEMKYCKQFGKSFESCRFFMDGNRIGKKQTPLELELVPVVFYCFFVSSSPWKNNFYIMRVIL